MRVPIDPFFGVGVINQSRFFLSRIVVLYFTFVNCSLAEPLLFCGEGGAQMQGVALADEAEVLDNHSDSFLASATWERRTSAAGYFGEDYAFRATSPVNDPASWQQKIDVSGLYDVEVRWTAGENRTPSAKYIVHHAEGDSTSTVDQRKLGGRWFLLGQYRFEKGSSARIELSCWSPAGAVVVADAVRFVLRSTCKSRSVEAPNFQKRVLGKTTLFEGNKSVLIGDVRADEFSSEEKAFLDTIAAAEGTSDLSFACAKASGGYGALFGCFEDQNRVFSRFTVHPDSYFTSAAGYRSAASGRYQFKPETWAWVAEQLGLSEISPLNQDRAARWLLGHRGALGHVNQIGSSRFDVFKSALYAARKEWASLPDSEYGQPTHSARDLWEVYQAAYSTYESQRLGGQPGHLAPGGNHDRVRGIPVPTHKVSGTFSDTAAPYLNLRNKAGTGGKVLARLVDGTTLVETARDKKWVNVVVVGGEFDGLEGWVHSKYLSSVSP
jgi:muramidase (phage lysozyme)